MEGQAWPRGARVPHALFPPGVAGAAVSREPVSHAESQAHPQPHGGGLGREVEEQPGALFLCITTLLFFSLLLLSHFLPEAFLKKH